MAHKNSRTGKGAAFFAGMLTGCAVGTVAVYLAFVPAGKSWLNDERISLKVKSADLYQNARKKTIDLKKAAGSLKRHRSDENPQMIPIPKDYI